MCRHGRVHCRACICMCVCMRAYPRMLFYAYVGVHIIPRSTCCRVHGCRTTRPYCSAPSPLLAAYPPACTLPPCHHRSDARAACAVHAAAARPVIGQRLASVHEAALSLSMARTIGDARHRTLCTGGTTTYRRPLAKPTAPDGHYTMGIRGTAQGGRTAQRSAVSSCGVQRLHAAARMA